MKAARPQARPRGFAQCFISEQGNPAQPLQLFKAFHVGDEHRRAAHSHFQRIGRRDTDAVAGGAGHHLFALLEQEAISSMHLSTFSSSVPMSSVMLPAIRKPPVVDSFVTEKPPFVSALQTAFASSLLTIAVIIFITIPPNITGRGVRLLLAFILAQIARKIHCRAGAGTNSPCQRQLLRFWFCQVRRVL